MKKSLVTLLILFTLFSPKIWAADFNSFELFWPVSAGSVAGDVVYPLKELKEKVRMLLIFSDLKKADFLIVLSEKRLLEAEKLLIDKKSDSNAKKTLESGQKNRNRILEIIKKAQQNKEYVQDTKNVFIKSLEKQKLLLMDLETRVSDDQKQLIKDDSQNLSSILEQLL